MEIKSQMNNSLIGKIPDIESTIPVFLTPEKTLKILKRILKETALKILKDLKTLKNEGFFNLLIKMNIFLFL